MVDVGQFFKYKHTPLNEVLKKLALAGTLTILITGILTWYFSMFNAFYTFLMAASVFAILSNLDYLFRFLKGKVKPDYTGLALARAGEEEDPILSVKDSSLQGKQQGIMILSIQFIAMIGFCPGLKIIYSMMHF